MECTSCAPTDPTAARPDRPHTFLAHEIASCPGCKLPGEARAVVQKDKLVHLLLCPSCGPMEWVVADDAKAYLAAMVARLDGTPNERGERFLKTTTSTCPNCLALLTAQVISREGKVFFQKSCPACGPSEALVSEDAEYYMRAYTFARAGTEPHVFATKSEAGCPTDCGTCGDHEQHTCLPIIEITDHCNLECPICIVDNQYANHISNADFSGIIDTLLRNEGQCESVALSGGEPTSHPRLLELIDIANRDEIGRVVIITNGIRLGKDRALAQAIKAKGAYVALQLDGFTADAHEKIRGRDLCAEKEAALAMLREFAIPTQLIFVAARGVNEDQIGRIVELFLQEEHYLSLSFQPAAFTGQGGGHFAHDPGDRLTIPGVIAAIERQSKGLLRKSDFAPLPCSHPQCVSLSYLLRLEDGSFLPFGRFIDYTRHGTLLRSSATLGASPEIEAGLQDVVYDVFARQDEVERGAEVLRALRRSLDLMFPGTPMTSKQSVRAGEGLAKSIFLHHYMDRHDFDLERLRKCCHHYPQIDGRIMPACGFNMFHRGAAKGADTPTAPFGKKPWTPKATDTPSIHTERTDTRHALLGIHAGEAPGRPPHDRPAPGLRLPILR